MTNIVLDFEQFEAVLKYAMNLGAYQATSGQRALYAARQAWGELRRLGTPMFVLTELETQVGKLP
ncbi:MAG: hypothetical protein J3T61_03340 [Candidatus Brocadiales bacterium]|nr:hypothetical protein [Candidatus Bathyanammoxibius sp.]